MRKITSAITVFVLCASAFAQTKPATDWPTASKDFTCQRFSELDQINADNARTLQVKWTFGPGTINGNESCPLVVGSTMYVITSYPNILYALDLKQDGQQKWKFESKTASAAQGEACCGPICRGAAYAEGKVIFNALDGRTIAVDAETGQQAWQTKLADFKQGEAMNMAPLVVGDRVIVGNAGGQFGARGWICGLDLATGKQIWKAFNTGPDADCLIGPSFKPFYDMDKGKDLGVKTWGNEKWKIGGSAVWGWVSYDPQLDLIFHGTGDPGGWYGDIRPGDNKWSSGIFARRPKTGEAVWYYQYTQHDEFGHDGINESVIADIELKPGEGKRKVLLHADRNGYFYVQDRQTGEILSATPFVRVTAYEGVDLQTGRLKLNPEKKPSHGKTIRDVAPATPGGKDWSPSAFSPRTGWLYMSNNTLAMDFENTEANYISGTPYSGSHAKFYPDPVEPGNQNMGRFAAWDPVAQKRVWGIEERFPVWGGTMVTAGDVAFYGTMDRWFKAVDAKTGKELWKFRTDSGIVGPPITYLGPDGKQYVAILSGVGGWPGMIVVNDLRPEDPGGAHGFLGAMKELPKYTAKGGTLYVFALP